MFVHRKSFITHSFTKQEAEESGTTRSQQRFEQCIEILESSMQPAMQAMFARKYFNNETQTAATQWVRDAIEDVRNVTKSSKYYSKGYRKYFANRLSEKIVVMFQDDILNETFIGDIYRDLEFHEEQPIFKMINVFKKFNTKVAGTEWYKKFQDCCIKGDIDISFNNVLCKYKMQYFPRFIDNACLNRCSCKVCSLSVFPSQTSELFQLCNDLRQGCV